MAITKRNYIPGEFEEVLNIQQPQINPNTWVYFVLDDYFKFELSDIVIRVDSETGPILTPGTDYELSRDDFYTDLESNYSGKILYGMIRYTNPAYSARTPFVSGNNFGTMVDNEQMKKYVDDSILGAGAEIRVYTGDFIVENNTINLIDTSAEVNPVEGIIQNASTTELRASIYKISSIDTPSVEVRTTGNQDIGDSPLQKIFGVSEGFSIVENTNKYEITQDSRGKVQKALSQSSMILSGFDVTITLPNTVNISAGAFAICDATNLIDPDTPIIRVGSQSVAITGVNVKGYTSLQIDENGTVFQTLNNMPSAKSQITMPRFCVVTHLEGNGNLDVGGVNPYWTVGQNPSSRFNNFLDFLGFIKNGISLFPSVNANLQIGNGVGQILAAGLDGNVDPLSPDLQVFPEQLTISFMKLVTRNDLITGYATAINPTLWDNNGTLQAVGGGTSNCTIQYVYATLAGLVAVHYGQNVYANLTVAREALFKGEDSFIENPILEKTAIQIGYIIVEHTATNLTDTDQALFILTNRFGDISGASAVASILHNSLGGLQGGDGITEFYHLNLNEYLESIILKTLQKVTDNGNITTNDIILDGSNLVVDGADSTTVITDNGFNTNTSSGASFDTYANDASSGFSAQAKNGDNLFESASVAVEPYTRDDSTKTVSVNITKQPICAEALNPATNTALTARGYVQPIAQNNNGKLAVVSTSLEFLGAISTEGISDIFIAPPNNTDKIVVEVTNTIVINSNINQLKIFGGKVEFKITSGTNLTFTFSGTGDCKLNFLNFVYFDSSIQTITGTNSYFGFVNILANSAIVFTTSISSSYERSRGENISGTIIKGYFDNSFINLYEPSNIDSPLSYLNSFLSHDYKNTTQEPTLPADGNLITSNVTVTGGTLRMSQVLVGRNGRMYYRVNTDNSNFGPWTEVGTTVIEAGFYESTFKFYLATTDLGSIAAQRLRFFEQKAVVAFTVSKIRLWASVSGGSITVAIYKGTVNNLTLAGQGVVSFTSAGYNEATLNIPVSISAGEEYWFVMFCTNSQTGSNTSIAAITAGAPLTSANLSTNNAVLLYLVTGSDTLPSTITTGMQKESAGAKIPFADFIQ